jgi:hypothetical protein
MAVTFAHQHSRPRACPAAMEKTAIDQPGVFFATCAGLIGPEVKLTIEQTLCCA